ncbi:MAG TPA: O-antigen ligase family protein [Candidatus Saccharimonadales bacterium]
MTTNQPQKRQKFLLSLATVCKYSAVSLVCLLPFLVPFTPNNNIDLQAYILIIAGLLAAISLLIKPVNIIKLYSKSSCVLVGVVLASYLLSSLTTSHLGYNLFGAPYFRFGLLGLISVILLALLINQSAKTKLSLYLFIYLCLLNLLAIPYTLYRLQSLYRFGGFYSQADLMAMMLGLNIVFGLDLIIKAKTKMHRLLIEMICLALFLELVLTQTRTVIYLVIIIGLIWYFIQFGLKIKKQALFFGLAVIAIFISTNYLVANTARLTSVDYAKDSISYRLNLQQDTAGQSLKKPLTGWGPGNIADAVNCKYLNQPELKKTCAQNFFFNSSHNIYLDHILMVGFIGGLAYLIFIVFNLYKSLKTGVKNNIFWFSSLLIGAYYLTNVTNIELETLFWISILAMILTTTKAASLAKKD